MEEMKFELKLSKISNVGHKNSNIFEDIFGKWTFNVNCNTRLEITGSIVLEAAFDGDSINPKDIKIMVTIFKKNDFKASVTAVPHGRFFFCFGPFPSNAIDLPLKVLVQVEMPQVPNGVTKNDGVTLHLKNLFETGNASDFVIGSENKIINVHMNILMRSEAFADLLTGDTKESKSGIAIIEDIKYEVLVEICRFLYSDELPKIRTHALDLLIAAKKYKINDLTTRCEKYLKRNMTTANVLNILTTANKHNSQKLRDSSISFIIKNCKTIFPSKAWKDLKRTNVKLTMLVLENLAIKCAKK